MMDSGLDSTNDSGHDTYQHPLKNWTKIEKWLMLKCFELPITKKVKFARFKPIDLMHITIVTKSAKRIQEAHDYFKDIVSQYNEMLLSTEMDVNLEQWLYIMNDVNPELTQRFKDTAAVLKLFADCKSIPPPEQTENMDVRRMFRQLSNAMLGKPIVANPVVANGILRALDYTVNLVRRYPHEPQAKDLLQELKNGETYVCEKLTGRPSDDMELRILSFLVDPETYIALEILKKNPEIAEKAAKMRMLKRRHPRGDRVDGAGCSTDKD